MAGAVAVLLCVHALAWWSCKRWFNGVLEAWKSPSMRSSGAEVLPGSTAAGVEAQRFGFM